MLKNVLLPRRKFPSLKQIIAGNIKCEELCVRDIRQVKTNFGRETTSGVFNKLNICGRHILEPRIWSGPAEECGRKEEKMDEMLKNLNGPWSNAACMGYCLIAMRRAGLRPTVQRRVLLAMEGAFDDVSVEKAEKAGYANTEE